MSGDRIKVGMVASLTGQFRGQGRQALEGATAWAADVNASGGIHVATHGKQLPVHLIYYDDRSRRAVAADMAGRLIAADGVDLLLGPYSSSLALAVAPVAERSQRALWNHGGASDRIYQQGYHWVVGVLSPASSYLHGIIDLVRELDPKASRLAVLRSERGSFPAQVALGAETAAAKRGFQTAFSAVYDSPAKDFSARLRELSNVGADLVIAVGRIEDDLLLAGQMAAGGFRTRAIALVAAGIAQFGQELGNLAEGFMGPSQWEPAAAYTPEYGPSAQELAHRHRMFNPGEGDYALAQAYAAGLVAQRCIEEAGTLDNGSLMETARRLDFTTFFGRFKIDPETGRQVGRSVVIVQWQRGCKVVVWPKELQEADPVYPAFVYP